jgi:single-strand DNA-binding protein
MVEGRLKLDQWEDKTSGQKRSRLKVVLDNVQFLGAPRGAGGGAGAPGGGDDVDQTAPSERAAPPARRQAAAPAPESLDEDVPF